MNCVRCSTEWSEPVKDSKGIEINIYYCPACGRAAPWSRAKKTENRLEIEVGVGFQTIERNVNQLVLKHIEIPKIANKEEREELHRKLDEINELLTLQTELISDIIWEEITDEQKAKATKIAQEWAKNY